MEKSRSSLRRAAAGAVAGAVTLPMVVHAAVPAEVSTALASIKDDAITVATAVVVALVAVYAFKFIRKGL